MNVVKSDAVLFLIYGLYTEEKMGCIDNTAVLDIVCICAE